MTLTIDLPEELACRLTERYPESERGLFAVSAIADALDLQEQEVDESRLIAALNAELNPALEPERDEAECLAIIEAEVTDMRAGGITYSFEEATRLMDANIAAYLAAKRP